MVAAAALRFVPTADAARALLQAAATLLTVLLAQLLHAHLQALAQQRASGHRVALAVAATQLPAFAAALRQAPWGLLRTAAAGPLAALAALVVTAVALLSAQLLAALLQALAHRFAALFGLLRAFATFGAGGGLAVRPLRLSALLGGGEGQEQADHEHQVFHCGHSHGALEGRGQRTPRSRSHLRRPRELSRLRLPGSARRQRTGAIGLLALRPDLQ